MTALVLQAASLGGAALVLAAFTGTSLGKLDPRGRPAQALNFAGSVVLCTVASIGGQWGFIVLNGTWAVVSVYGLARSFVSRS